jgi:hypothetical protein
MGNSSRSSLPKATSFLKKHTTEYLLGTMKEKRIVLSDSPPREKEDLTLQLIK